MERLEEHKPFLEELMKSNLSKRKLLIRTCESDNIKAIIEVCINLNSFPYNKSELKELTACKALLTLLIRKRKSSIVEFRSILFKHQSVLPVIISTILTKIIEGSFCSFLNNG